MAPIYSLGVRRHELSDRGVRLAGPLELGDVTAVELHVPGSREGPLHVLHERQRYDGVAATPDEHRVALQASEAGPESVLAVGLVEVDVPRGLVERGAPTRCEIAPQELVDAG